MCFFAPAVVDGVVYSSAVSGPLYALDAATGKILWQSDTPFGLAFTPVVVDDVVYYAGSANRYVYALRGSNGELLWRQAPKNGTASSLSVRAGVIYVFSYDGGVDALRAEAVNPR